MHKACHDNCSVHMYLASQVSHVTFCFSLKSFSAILVAVKTWEMGELFERCYYYFFKTGLHIFQGTHCQ